MPNTNRSKNPWVGNPSKTKETRPFGGYFYYYQIRYFDGLKLKGKKFYYDQGDDASEKKAYENALKFKNDMTIKLNIQKDK